jgi:hypothetical protein
MFARTTPTPMRVPGLLVLAMAVALCAGCGGETSKPVPQLAVMGAIHLVPSPAEGPYQAGVVVAVDGQVITNAVVHINDSPLVYNSDPAHPDQAGYGGLVSLQEGQTAELTVSCSAGEKTLRVVVPGFAHIVSPVMGATFPDDQDIDVTWTPATHASLSIVACAGASTAKPGTWVLLGNATAQTVPSSYTTPPGSRISVIALSGVGDLPSLDLRTWVGKNGFWATSEASVDIAVAG